MNDCVSLNPVPNGAYHYQNAHRMPLCPRTFLTDLWSFMCDIEYNELKLNWRINNLSNVTMTHQDLDATDRIL
jgi:hypothetical protein